METRILIPLLAALAAAGHAAAGTPTFEYTDLGTLGGPEARAFGLNDARQVVGWSNVSAENDCPAEGRPCRHAFLWTDGSMEGLGLLAGDEESVGRAINDAGLIVGTSERDVIAGSGVFHGFSWDGTMTPLPDLGQGQSFVHDVNENGVIVGWTQDPDVFRDRAVTWVGGVIDNLGDDEPHQYNRGVGLNDTGIVVGFAWNLFSPNDAMLHDGNRWVQIGGFGQFQNAEANDVNNPGLAVGLMAHPQGDWHATTWAPDGTVTDLGLLPDTLLSELSDVNDAGHAVGRSYSDTTSRAIYYDGVALHDLNDFAPEGFDGVLWDASEINEHGDIAGTALVDGRFRAFLMTVSVPCPGDVDGDGAVTFGDLIDLLASWGPCAGCPADLDGDGFVTFADILILLGHWGPCAG